MAKRQVFYSFHYEKDNWRTSQIRQIGAIEGNKLVSDNDWEEIKKDEKAIKKWIDDSLKNRSCTIVLVGQKTADRKWINYEIQKSWKDRKGLIGIYIHNLKDSDGEQSFKGKNPFEKIEITMKDGTEKNLSNIVICYNPPYSESKKVYEDIENKLTDLVEESITIRNYWYKTYCRN